MAATGSIGRWTVSAARTATTSCRSSRESHPGVAAANEPSRSSSASPSVPSRSDWTPTSSALFPRCGTNQWRVASRDQLMTNHLAARCIRRSHQVLTFPVTLQPSHTCDDTNSFVANGTGVYACTVARPPSFNRRHTSHGLCCAVLINDVPIIPRSKPSGFVRLAGLRQHIQWGIAWVVQPITQASFVEFEST